MYTQQNTHAMFAVKQVSPDDKPLVGMRFDNFFSTKVLMSSHILCIIHYAQTLSMALQWTAVKKYNMHVSGISHILDYVLFASSSAADEATQDTHSFFTSR